MRAWHRIGIGIAVLVVITAGVAALALYSLTHRGAIYRYALDQVRARAQQALGPGTEIGGFQLQFQGVSPSVDIDHLVIPGAAPWVNPPLLTVAHVHVGVRVTSLLHRSWQLQEVIADQPVIQIFQDAQGRTNLPRPSGHAAAGPDLFAIGVRHAVVRNGTFRFNSRQSRLLADLRDLHVEAGYVPASKSYQGAFGYRDGSLQVQNFRPIPHSLETRFRATSAGIELSPLHLTSGRNGTTRLDASVYLADYSHPDITAGYALSLDTNQVAAILRQAQVPRGRVEIRGRATWTGARGGDTLAGLTTSGDFRSTLLQAEINDRGLPLRDLSGSFRLADDGLTVTAIRARVLGGGVAAQAAIRNLEHGAPGQATWDWRGAPLAEVVRWAAGAPAAASTRPLNGAAQAHGNAHWHDGFQDLVAGGQAALDGTIAAQPAPLPLHAAAAFQFSHNLVQLQPATVVAAGTHLTVTGSIATQGHGSTALAVELTAPDLGQLETAANAIASAASHPLPRLDLGGAAAFRGTISGSLTAPAITGRAQATGFRARGTQWRALATDLMISPDEFSATNGLLQAGGAEAIHFEINARLSQWTSQPASPLQARISVKGMPLSQVAAWAAAKLPLQGVLDADLNFQGSAQHPAGQGSLHIARPELILDRLTEPLGAIQLDLQSQGTNIGAKLQVALPAGTIHGAGTFDPSTRSYQAQLDAPAIDLKRLHFVDQRKLPVSGVVALAAHGAGTLANPGATVEISSPRLLLQDQPVTQVALQATLANHVVDAHLTSNAISTSLQGSARVALQDGYPAVATFDTGRIPVAALVAAVAPGAGVELHGETEIHAHLDGPLADVRRLRATITLPQLTLDYGQQYHLATTQPVRLDLANGIVTLASARLAGTGTQLQAAGTIPLTGGAPMDVTAKGTVDLKIVQAMNPALATGGELQLNLQATGALPRPAVSGTIGVVNASLASTSLPITVQNGTGSLRLNGDRIAISNFHANVGGGTLTASGALTFRPQVQFDLGVQTEQVRLQLPQSVRETVGGNLSLTGTPESALLQGRFRVESVTVTPQFDLTKVIGNLSSSSATVATPGSFLQNLNLNVAITTPNQIHIVSRDFSTQAGANLTVRGTAAEPVILGRVNITSGDLIFRGSRYVLQSGALDFVNPNQTMPIVNITADTTIQQYNLHLNFQGPADNLRTAYTSDPALPPADIINLLAFGTTTEASAANPTPGNLGAENLIASAVSSQITDRVQRIAGISQLSVDPVLGGGQQNAGARITIQQRVTGNLFVTVSTDVTSTQRNVIEIQYKLSPRVALNAVRDQNGGFGVNTQFKKVW